MFGQPLVLLECFQLPAKHQAQPWTMTLTHHRWASSSHRPLVANYSILIMSNQWLVVSSRTCDCHFCHSLLITKIVTSERENNQKPKTLINSSWLFSPHIIVQSGKLRLASQGRREQGSSSYRWSNPFWSSEIPSLSETAEQGQVGTTMPASENP